MFKQLLASKYHASGGAGEGVHICVTAVCFTLLLHDATIRNAMLEAYVAPSHLLSSATESLAAYGLLPGTPHQHFFLLASF